MLFTDTEIDWQAYMQQVSQFKAGERDYMKMYGGTGPLVYPAGFLYVFSILHTVTNGGENIRLGTSSPLFPTCVETSADLFLFVLLPAQYIFLGFYLITIATVLAIYYRARVLPPWAAVLLCVSKRLHSIFLLRLFNDGIAMMLLYIAVYLFCRQQWRAGCALFSFAVSIKMNVLLFAPALFFLLLQSCGLLRTIYYLGICATIQLVLALPFLRHNWVNYLSRAFELSRVFTFKWTVNWKFLDEDVFVSKWLALALLAGHVFFLVLFLDKHFRIIGTFQAVLAKPFVMYEPFPIRAEVIVTSLFVINYVGIAFARSLHYQFYVWFFPTLPYLLWKANVPMLFKIKSFLLIEYAFNTFPSTPISSLVLQLSNVFILISLYFTDDHHQYLPYLDAEARQNLIEFINGGEVFDGPRLLAMYYGSVTEDLAEGAFVASIDEREVVMRLPKMRLTLAVGFGSSAPVTTEGYGRQVLQAMAAEAQEGVAAGETMGKVVSREYYKDKAEKELNEAAAKKEKEKNKSLRQRGGGSAEP
jgi:alpha-1,3-mannosyltransferase